MQTSADVLARYRESGRFFDAMETRSFVLEQGSNDAVLCLHGVPASAFLYRKLIPELAARGLRGIAFDLPGLGLAGRPPSFDYSWSGLGRFCAAAVDALRLQSFHLVVHDIGGPVGFELARLMPTRILSLTILNTLLEVHRFRRPLPMKPFAVPFIGRLALQGMGRENFIRQMYRMGIEDRTAVGAEEVGVHYDLLKREDGGRAFLKIMRGFELTIEKRDHYLSAIRDVPYPVQVIWGSKDPGLKLENQGEDFRRALGLPALFTVPARHFLQEDQAPAIAEKIAGFVREL